MAFDVKVSRMDFDNTLKLVKKFNKTRKPYDLILDLAGDTLLLITPVATLQLLAMGAADCRIQLPGQVVVRMLGTFPNVEFLQFKLEGTALKIGRLTMTCTVAGRS